MLALFDIKGWLNSGGLALAAAIVFAESGLLIGFFLPGDSLLFIAGFSAVFIALGLSATTVGQTLFRNQSLLTRVSGAVVLAMALFMLGSLFLNAPWMYQERRFHPKLSRFGPFAAPVAGGLGLGDSGVWLLRVVSVLALLRDPQGDITLGVPKLFFGYATGTDLLFPFAVGGAAALFSERSTRTGNGLLRIRAAISMTWSLPVLFSSAVLRTNS